MPQIQCPIDYVPLQQVTAANLNAHVNSAVILPGIITDQTNLTANTVASGDSVLLYDLSATALREATAGDLLGSNVPVTTSAITAGANSDIVITPNDGVIVTGQAYTSGDGQTVTVTSTAHTLTVGQVILVTAATATDYNGTFRVTTVATNSFTYVIFPGVTAGSGTLSYTKKALVKNPANKSIAGNLYVDGTMEVNGSAKFSQSVLASGSVTSSGPFTSSGTANFTGALQVNGTVGYVLYEVLEQSASYWNATTPTNYSGVFTSSTFTKPSDEIWRFEISYNVYGDTGYGMGVGVRYNSQTAYTGTYKFLEYYTVATHSYSLYHRTHSWTEGVGVTLTAESVKVDACAGASTAMAMFLTSTSTTAYGVFAGFTTPITPSKFRIYKYKTA